jgi:hypothetical protein
MGTWDTMVTERVFSPCCLLSLFLDTALWHGTNLSEGRIDSGKLAGWSGRMRLSKPAGGVGEV